MRRIFRVRASWGRLWVGSAAAAVPRVALVVVVFWDWDWFWARKEAVGPERVDMEGLIWEVGSARGLTEGVGVPGFC